MQITDFKILGRNKIRKEGCISEEVYACHMIIECIIYHNKMVMRYAVRQWAYCLDPPLPPPATREHEKKTIDVLYKEGRGEAVFRTFLYDLNAWYIYIYTHIIYSVMQSDRNTF